MSAQLSGSWRLSAAPTIGIARPARRGKRVQPVQVQVALRERDLDTPFPEQPHDLEPYLGGDAEWSESGRIAR